MAFFGLGLIGKSLTQRLIAADFQVIGHDPDSAQIERIHWGEGNFRVT
ncbi:MAG: hypothetical protein ABJE99_04515 [Roseobacter sp.]